MNSDLVFGASQGDAAFVPFEQRRPAETRQRVRSSLPNWRIAWRRLSHCWCDPDASKDVAAGYRLRQFHALLEQIPLSSFNCFLFSLLTAWLCWNDTQSALLIAWCAAIWGTSAISLVIWYRHRQAGSGSKYELAARQLTTLITISALLFSVIPTYLFGAADLREKIILVSIATGFVAHGALQSARWPVAGILWSIGMCFGGATAMFYLYGDTYSYLAWMTLVYCAIVIISVLLASKLFMKSLIAETKIDQQKQFISLLLNDFEDDANDWLWETDQRGNLRHASNRLAEILDVSPASLHGQGLDSVLFIGDDMSTGDLQYRSHELAACFQGGTAFRNIELSFLRNGKPGWWSLSGKPLLDTRGRITGWRGVGSDITAARLHQIAEHKLRDSREAAARVAGELDTARRIQMGLLPDLAAVTTAESRFSVAAILEPAREVGGDYYECFSLDEHRYCFAVADVSGKGVPASLFMAMTKALASSLMRRYTTLGDAVSEISSELDRNNPEMFFVTAFFAVLDTRSGELTCVSAGHDAPLLLSGGQVSRIALGEKQGPPMCAIPGYRFLSETHKLQHGDTICLFTDGATEATNGTSFFGPDRLAAAFVSQPREAATADYADALRQKIREFESGTQAADDLTIMVMRWHGAAT